MSELTMTQCLQYLCDEEPAGESAWEESELADSELMMGEADACLWDDPSAVSDDDILACRADPWAMDISDDCLMSAGAAARTPCPETARDFRAMGMTREQADLWEHLVDALSLNHPCPLPVMDVLLRAPGYRDRIMIMSFAYVNGCDGNLIIQWYALCGRFLDKPCRLKHLENLRRDIHLRSPNTCDRWYSYNMYAQQWEFLSGVVKDR